MGTMPSVSSRGFGLLQGGQHRCCLIPKKPGRVFVLALFYSGGFSKDTQAGGDSSNRGNFGPFPTCCLLVPSAPSGHCQSFSPGPGAPECPPEGCVGFVSACKRKAGTRRAETRQPGMPLCAPEGSAGAGDRLVHIVCCQGIFWSLFFFHWCYFNLLFSHIKLPLSTECREVLGLCPL